MDAEDGFTESTAELARCAKFNFDQVKKFTPSVTSNPNYIVAMEQMNAICKRLDAAEAE